MASKKQRNSNKTAKSTSKSTKAEQQNLVHSELVEVRNSPIHGRGVYAVRPIKKGTRIYEYVGERITHTEADKRFWRKRNDGHTFLFVVNRRTVIDGSRKGNDARYINHLCNVNCETITDNNRIFIEATRDIKKGEELGYDYQLTWSQDDTPEDLALYNCRCGAKRCRGTMLDTQSIEQHLAEDLAKRKRAKARATAKTTASKKKASKKKTVKNKAAKKKTIAKRSKK
ncbi:MAG: SET domain-containing protein [Steroidobacteraceae bacterium]